MAPGELTPRVRSGIPVHWWRGTVSPSQPGPARRRRVAATHQDVLGARSWAGAQEPA